MWNGAPGSSTASAPARASANGFRLEKCAVARRVHVREVENRPDEVDLRRDREHVVDRAEVAHPAHHLDAERNESVFRFEPLAQVAELVDDVGDRLLSLPPEQEAGMEDDQPRAAGLGQPGGVVEHAERHLELLAAVGMAHEGGERRVHGEATSAAAAASPNSGAAS